MLFGVVSPCLFAYQHHSCRSRTRRFGAGYCGVVANIISCALSVGDIVRRSGRGSMLTEDCHVRYIEQVLYNAVVQFFLS
jgi:hypothetical protein